MTIDLPWPCSNEEYVRIMTGFIREVMARGSAIWRLAISTSGRARLPGAPARGNRHHAAVPALGQRYDRAGAADDGRRAPGQGLHPGSGQAGRRVGWSWLARPSLAALPAGVDPCGENGEFHTLAWDGPMFLHPLPIRVGKRCCGTASSSPICWRRIPNEGKTPSGERKGAGSVRNRPLCVCPLSGRRRCRNWRACRCQNRV